MKKYWLWNNFINNFASIDDDDEGTGGIYAAIYIVRLNLISGIHSPNTMESYNNFYANKYKNDK